DLPQVMKFTCMSVPVRIYGKVIINEFAYVGVLAGWQMEALLERLLNACKEIQELPDSLIVFVGKVAIVLREHGSLRVIADKARLAAGSQAAPSVSRRFSHGRYWAMVVMRYSRRRVGEILGKHAKDNFSGAPTLSRSHSGTSRSPAISAW